MNPFKPNLIPVPIRTATSLLAVTFAATLFGQTTATDRTTSGTTPGATPAVTTEKTLNHTDRKFVDKVAESGREEVAISRVAVERSTNPDVKRFAQMMIDDHSRANEELLTLAAARGITLKDKDAHADKWAKKDAKDFDRDYIKKMVEDHKDTIDLFTKESKSGADTELVEFSRKTLSKLEHHLQEADELRRTLKP